MIRATFQEIVRRLTKFDTSKKFFKNGVNNDYTETMEAVRNNSVTASVASNIMVQYLIGKGFGEFDNFEFNGVKAIDFAEDIAQDITNNRGVFIRVDYDGNYDISNYEVLPFESCRIGQKDSSDYNGKIIYKADWQDSKCSEIVFDVFNPDKKVVSYQVEKAKGIDKYHGQIFYYSMDRKLVYPLNRLNAVSTECDNEAQASAYKNTVVRRGFFGKTLVITRPLIEDDVYRDISDEGIAELRRQESERENFKKTINEFVGADNAGGVMHMELEFESEDLEKAILFKNIESNINPDMFKTLEDSAVTKILMAYNNLPVSLVKSPDSALLGNSGEAIKEAKKLYWENTNKERNIVETIVNDFWKLHRDFDSEYKTIIKLIEDEQIINNNTAL